MVATHSEAHRPRRITAQFLADRYEGTSVRWWQDRLKILAREGLLQKWGGLYMGDPEAIDAALPGLDLSLG